MKKRMRLQRIKCAYVSLGDGVMEVTMKAQDFKVLLRLAEAAVRWHRLGTVEQATRNAKALDRAVDRLLEPVDE